MATKETRRKIIDVISDFLRPAQTAGTGDPYFEALAATPLTGKTDLKKLKKDFAEDQTLWRAIREDTDETVANLPSYEEFDAALRPWIGEWSGVLGSPIKGGVDAARRPYEATPRLAAAGVEAPSFAGANSKGVVDIDRQTRALIAEGRIDDALKLLYDQTVALARQTPMGLVRNARKTRSVFYPIRELRNQIISERTGAPKAVIDILTSINSANAGPFIENTRSLALLPFLRMKNGAITVDRAAAKKVLGPAFLRGPGVSTAIKAIESGRVFDPNYVDVGLPAGMTWDEVAKLPVAQQRKILNSPASRAGIPGLSAKTWPYLTLARNSQANLPLVADTIDAGARAGTKAQMPSGPAESLIGQVADRTVARALGIQNAAAQEINWFISRILRGPASSANPFESFPTPDAMERALRGELVVSPHAGRFSEASDRLISENMQRYLATRGQLLDPEVASYMQEMSNAFDLSMQTAVQKKAAKETLTPDESRLVEMYTVIDGQAVPSDKNVAAIIPPQFRTTETVQMTRDALRAINKIQSPAQRRAAKKHLLSLFFIVGAAGTVVGSRANPDAIERMAQG